MICHRCSDDEVFTVVLKLDLKERKVFKVVNKRIEDAYNSNITNESNIINTYYIPEINKGILKYKDLDDDMKEEVFKSI